MTHYRIKKTEETIWPPLVKKLVEELFKDLFEQKSQELKSDIEKTLEQILKRTLKGDAGFTPLKGRDYFDGETPIKGVHYFTQAEIEEMVKMATPVKGIDYSDGKDGESPSPEVVAQILANKMPKPKEYKAEDLIKLINNSKTKIDRSAVKGLEELIENTKRVARAKGGGMGNVQHQSFNVGISTTTVITTYKIAGNGFAIWAYYNGQFIARGTHYTVGSDLQTLTLTFTPQNSTVIDVVYIRG